MFTTQSRTRASTRPVTVTYEAFDVLGALCEIDDFTDGIYSAPDTPYDKAQAAQRAYLLDEIDCREGSRVLDIGCGTSSLLRDIRSRGALPVGITLSPRQVDRAVSQGLEAHCVNYRDLADGRWDGRFDGITANGSLEHFVQPADVVAGRQGAIYQEFFSICHRLLKPGSHGKVAITAIHYRHPQDPRRLARNPFLLPWGSESFHLSLLHAAFGDYYPYGDDLPRSGADYFTNLRRVDGTVDYQLTSEEWLRRVWATLALPERRRQFVREAIASMLRAPLQSIEMTVCMLLSESWNWQFRYRRRGQYPPTVLYRDTFQAL